MQEFLRFPYLNSVSITAFLVAGILGGIIGYSTQHNTKLYYWSMFIGWIICFVVGQLGKVQGWW